MNILPGLLNKKGVYWPPGAMNKFGRHAAGDPVVIDCASSQTNQTITRPDGKTLAVTSEIFTDTKVVRDGWIWVGDVLEAPDAPLEEHRIQQVRHHNDVDDVEQLWIASI